MLEIMVLTLNFVRGNVQQPLEKKWKSHPALVIIIIVNIKFAVARGSERKYK